MWFPGSGPARWEARERRTVRGSSERHGNSYGAATVTWVSQASFKPPLLMAAIRPESNMSKCLSQSRVAAIHIVDTGGDHALIVMEALDAACAEDVRPLTIAASPWEYGG